MAKKRGTSEKDIDRMMSRLRNDTRTFDNYGDDDAWREYASRMIFKTPDITEGQEGLLFDLRDRLEADTSISQIFSASDRLQRELLGGVRSLLVETRAGTLTRVARDATTGRFISRGEYYRRINLVR